jgi:hypothetical protein
MQENHSQTTRRRFLVSTASIAAGGTAMALASPVQADSGAQFERMIVEYVDVGLERARLHRAADAAHIEKFGPDHHDNLTIEGRAKFAASKKCSRVTDAIKHRKEAAIYLI